MLCQHMQAVSTNVVCARHRYCLIVYYTIKGFWSQFSRTQWETKI